MGGQGEPPVKRDGICTCACHSGSVTVTLLDTFVVRLEFRF